MDYAKLRNYRHADPLKVRQVWDTVGTVKGQRLVVPTDKLVKSLRKKFGLKDDQIRLLLDEIEGDGLIEKIDPSFGKLGPTGYRLPDFSVPCARGKHDWYCFQCHKPGEVLRCSDCFRVYHMECAQEAAQLSSPSGKSIRSPTLHDGFFDDFSCAVCESRPKCEFSRKQIRKLLEFATHHLRKQPLWKTFLHIGYPNEINKNEFIVYKYTDLELLQRKIKDGRYAALEEFSMDVQLLVHDVCILHGPYSVQADEVRFFLRSVNEELNEIQLCTDCYINAKTRLADWISKPCKPPHELIWARNRTSTGAGFFNDAVISQYYWPGKVLLERDDSYEIRFFGGTHERALVRKSDTRPFHVPADEIGVLRRNNTSGTLSGGGFERAWNEVSKLQANIESGYYTHSSGESDLPPSDEDYSDEIYLGPRRGSLNKTSRANRTESPLSSSASHNTKKVKRRRHTSSSSHQTTTSATPTSDPPSPVLTTAITRLTQPQAVTKSYKSHNRGVDGPPDLGYNDRKKIPSRLSMPSVLPGTPGAAAISALAETKAAMAAAVGGPHRSGGALTTDLFNLTSKHDSVLDHKIRTSITSHRLLTTKPSRGRRGPGRPPKSDNQVRKALPRKKSLSSLSASVSSKSISPLSSDSGSDLENGAHAMSGPSDDSENNWLPKKNSSRRKIKRQPRGRSRTAGLSKLAVETTQSTMLSSGAGNTNDLWPGVAGRPTKLASPTRGRPRSRNLKNVMSPAKMTTTNLKRPDVSGKNSALESPRSGGKKTRRSSKHGNVVNNLNDRRDEDDELTDRCCSPVIGTESPTRICRTQRGQQRLTSHSQSPSLQLSPGRKNLPAGLGASVTVKPSPTKRTSSATPKRRSSPSSNLSSYSSPSTSDADSDSGFTNRRRTLTSKNGEEDRKFRSPTRNSLGTKEMKMSGTSGTMLRRPPFAPPLTASNTSSGMGARPPSDASNLTAATDLLYSSRQWSNISGVHDHTGSSATPAAAVLAAAASLAGSNHPLVGALGTVASGLLTASSSSASGVSSLPALGVGLSTLPRSHLPPNKRAAAAATAAALSGTGNGLTASYDMTGHLYGHQISPRGLDPLPPSPKKVVHKGVQTASQSCPDCKEREAQRLAELEEHKRALQELEERLTEQFKEEQAAATQAALEQAQLSMREAVEREQKLALEASEARFAEVLVQTKRRQWCRNCLSEAIYHCCWNTSYCSIPCQQEHWQNEHKRQCRRKR
ncbi:Zinc finger MYND domain-containing protein 11 [Paragonimus heterotremus]|uniref:Zinc finger MYND domain-containing protein 11 n=1 Tax=Paragonimus heterotremus TaxID=100268 RepID=A0A8J4X1C1_9TREM|nr:Zinc finger MYND domain-containing protein 11 [Paragonimus heterotremus]